MDFLKVCNRADNLPLIKDKETSHILVTGTTGSGKSNCFNTLLPIIQNRGNSGVILDFTGDFIKRYYRPGKDIILNPFDPRGRGWSPFVECSKDQHFAGIAQTIVPETNKNDSFWTSAARSILAEGFKKLKYEQDITKLTDLILKASSSKFEKFFSDTPAATYTNKDGEKMTMSIRATLANHLQSFKYINQEDLFSIRNWVTSDPRDQWVFISCSCDERAVMRPIMTCWIDIAINSLMNLAPNKDRRFWFILDEMPAIHKIPSLGTGLAELRKYGGCILSGIQNVSQIEDTYGLTKARSLLDLYNTKIFFRSSDATTTSWISKVLGESETTESIENTSFGANTMRDGVSTSKQTKTKPLILPSQISDLEDLQAYVKLPNGFPITKTKLTFKKEK